MTEKLKEEKISDPANVSERKRFKLGNVRVASDEELGLDFKENDVDLDYEKLVDSRGIDGYLTFPAISDDLEIESNGKITKKERNQEDINR